jgi:type II secretory pathway pseudopilin PulG
MELRTDRRLGAFGLVEILVVMVIIVALAAFLYPKYIGNRRGADGKATTPLAKAHDTECMMNIRSARQSIAAFHATDDEKYPSSLNDLRELPKECRECVVSHMAYQYNPQTGEIHCPFPAHQGY